MKPVLIGALLLGGAYFLLKDNIAQFAQKPTSNGAGGTPPPDTPPTNPGPNLPAIKAAIKAKINATGSGSILNTKQGPDTWDWWAMQAYPVWTAPAPESLFAGKANPRDPISFEEWFTAAAPAFPATGLAGVRADGSAPSMGKRRPARQAWS